MAEGGFAARFEQWADHQPHALAVIDDDGRRLTYLELEQAANRLANAIDDLDPDRRFPVVAIALEQGIPAIVAIVAVSKSGRTQVPLDPGDPPARLAEVLGHLQPAVLVSGDRPDALAQVPAERSLRLGFSDPAVASASPARRTRSIDPHATALVVLTSGTTGAPKAAMRTYEAIVELTQRDLAEHRVPPSARHAIVADHQWAAGWAAIRKALTSGGTAVRYAARTRGPSDLARFLAEHDVEVLGAVPSLVRAMLDADPDTQLPALRRVTFTGDILHRDLVLRLFDRLGPEAEVVTSYGASELGSVAKLTMRRDTVPEGEVVPVGLVSPRAEVEIEDPGPDGVGRLVVTSRRGAPAYEGANDRDRSVEALPDGRFRHRTSDLGRVRPDGLLEITGRQPHLVKVRGQRVGVSEVEAALLAIDGVVDAGVGVHPDDPGQRLTAWYVASPDAAPPVADLRQHLRGRLPAFMVPAAFVALPALPRGTRGKLLRHELPVPSSDRPHLGHPYEPAVGPVEEVVAGAFARVLHLDRVGRHDALFDLGGDSLHAAEVMTLIAATLGRDLPLSAFLEAATPARLADRLDPASGAPPEGRLVDLQREGPEPALYCIHGGGGQVLSLAGLAERMGARRPFVAVQMRQDDKVRALFRVNRLADRYAREIAARQGPSPCVVAGHSYGGIVAQELSRRLVDLGTPVVACVLLDANVPHRRLLAGRRRRARALGELDATSALKEVLYGAHALLGLAPKPHRLLTERMIAALWGMSWHRPRRTAAPIVAVRASGDPADADPGAWAEHTTGGCRVLDAPGGHNSMLAAPHVDDLAAILDGELGRLAAVTPA